MDNLRLILWAGFFVLLWLAISQWNSDYVVPNQPDLAKAQTNALPGQAGSNSNKTTSVLELSDKLPAIVVDANEQLTPSEKPALATRLLTVTTDVFELGINPDKGGDIVQAKLLKYFPSKDDTAAPIELLSYDEDGYQYFQTGLLSLNDLPEPNHQQAFVEKNKKIELKQGQDQVSASLVWAVNQERANLEVVKSYTFKRGRYDILLTYDVKNLGAQDYTFVLYNQLVKKDKKQERSMFNVETYSFNGPIIFDGSSYQKLDISELATTPIRETHTNGWVSNIQHHFLVAMVPRDQPYTFTANSDPVNELYKLAMVGQTPVTVRPGKRVQVSTTLVVGPKIQEQLKDIAPGLELSVDFGKLTFLSAPLFWLLEKTHRLVQNWGVAIILVTLLIKLLFYPLTEASGRSMAKMRKVTPRIKAIQDRYKDDKQAQSQAMMELYKKEKVNPMAGCWPMLIQIPFFIAFYWVLLESVEIRQAPFFLWIQDLSSRDPYFVLPLIMGLGMFFQQKLNPAPPDPMQAKVMTAMPIMFTAMFAFFPSGLVLYWLTNSLLSIAQQWKINRALQ